MIEFLQKLIRIQSISPRDEGCFDLIEERLKKLNFSCERINYLNVENLYATYGTEGKLFCFLGHTDVVPTDNKYWETDPFQATEIDGYLHGRGTLDMKGTGISHLASFIKLYINKQKTLMAIEKLIQILKA